MMLPGLSTRALPSRVAIATKSISASSPSNPVSVCARKPSDPHHLRFMQPQAHAEFKDIVLKGTRSAKGMQSFADVVSEADAADIHAYLVARAREDYQK